MTVPTDSAVSCRWCGRPCRRTESAREQRIYCSRLHQNWAESVARGEYPKTECPRCGHVDLRIAGPDWAICQTCGHQTDRPDLPSGALTPRNMTINMRDTRERLAINSRRRRR